MPTIAYIAGQFPLLSETFVWREVRGLRARGWTVHTFGLHTPTSVPSELEDLAETTQSVYDDLPSCTCMANLARATKDAISPGESLGVKDRGKLLVQSQAASRLSKAINARGIKHIHAHFAHAPATIAMYAAQRSNISFSFTGHANDLFARRQLLARKIERANFVGCISHWHRELYRQTDEVDSADVETKLPIIRCGVEVPEEVVQLPTGVIGTRERQLHVTAVARLVEKKGIDTLLKATAEAIDAGKWIRLNIVGDGPMKDQLHKLAGDLKISSSVHWHGSQSNEKVRHLLAHETDVFMLPTRVDSRGDKDGIPVVLMEAMAAGVPVMCGTLPSIDELVQDGKTGLSADGTRADLFAKALVTLADDSELRHRLAAAGRAHVQQEFSLGVNLDRLELALRHAMADKS